MSCFMLSSHLYLGLPCDLLFRGFHLVILQQLNPLHAELNPICHLLALLGAHHIFHVSRLTVNLGTRGAVM